MAIESKQKLYPNHKSQITKSHMRRVVTPELLDSDSGTPREVADALRDLRMFSRWFGGTSTTASLLRRVVQRSGQRELRVLDVAAGPGEPVSGAARELEKQGIRLRVTLLDRSASHMPRNGTPSIVGDALRLSFADGSFDITTSSLRRFWARLRILCIQTISRYSPSILSTLSI